MVLVRGLAGCPRACSGAALVLYNALPSLSLPRAIYPQTAYTRGEPSGAEPASSGAGIDVPRLHARRLTREREKEGERPSREEREPGDLSSASTLAASLSRASSRRAEWHRTAPRTRAPVHLHTSFARIHIYTQTVRARAYLYSENTDTDRDGY